MTYAIGYPKNTTPDFKAHVDGAEATEAEAGATVSIVAASLHNPFSTYTVTVTRDDTGAQVATWTFDGMSAPTMEFTMPASDVLVSWIELLKVDDEDVPLE